MFTFFFSLLQVRTSCSLFFNTRWTIIPSLAGTILKLTITRLNLHVRTAAGCCFKFWISDVVGSAEGSVDPEVPHFVALVEPLFLPLSHFCLRSFVSSSLLSAVLFMRRSTSTGWRSCWRSWGGMWTTSDPSHTHLHSADAFRGTKTRRAPTEPSSTLFLSRWGSFVSSLIKTEIFFRRDDRTKWLIEMVKILIRLRTNRIVTV